MADTVHETIYKWQSGVYSLSDMLILVEYKVISKEQFEKITRLSYQAAKEKRG